MRSFGNDEFAFLGANTPLFTVSALEKKKAYSVSPSTRFHGFCISRIDSLVIYVCLLPRVSLDQPPDMRRGCVVQRVLQTSTSPNLVEL
jgi:hypothetical protein